MAASCGIDWADDHHDVAVVDQDGKVIGKRRVTDDASGLRTVLELLASCGESPDDPIPVAVETARGLLLSCLRTTGRRMYSINPMSVARYRERHRVARAKSDHADAVTLANILRTDADAHRPLPSDPELAQSITVLARAQQDAVWHRTQLSNQLRSHLRQYLPAALEAFQISGVGLDSREARAVLAAASDPGAAAGMSAARLTGVLRKSGRQRNIAAWVERLQTREPIFCLQAFAASAPSSSRSSPGPSCRRIGSSTREYLHQSKYFRAC